MLRNVPYATHMPKPIKREPFLPHSVPMRPWHTVGADFRNQDYVLYMWIIFSNYLEVIPVQYKTAEETLKVFKTVFA